jgi:hypothetical protein
MAEKKHRIHTTSVARVYPHYVAKAERKGCTKAEVDEIICWLTGYEQQTAVHERAWVSRRACTRRTRVA